MVDGPFVGSKCSVPLCSKCSEFVIIIFYLFLCSFSHLHVSVFLSLFLKHAERILSTI